MRIRTVKPEWWSHKMHKRLSEPAALLGLALLNFADDEGRFEWDPETVKGLLFTHRTLTKSLEDCVQELGADGVGWLVLYPGTVDNERVTLGQIVNFSRHQVVNKMKRSRFQEPPADLLKKVARPKALPDASRSDTGTVRDGSDVQESSEHVVLLRSMEGRKEGKGKEGNEGETRSRVFSEPTLDEVLTEANLRGIGSDCAEKFFYDNKAAGWIDGRERPIVDWRSALRGYAISWRQLDYKKTAAASRSGSVSTQEGDEPEWSTMSVDQLRNDAMGLAQSRDAKKKEKAARMMEIVREREKGRKN